jgi:hypothetical protein
MAAAELPGAETVGSVTVIRHVVILLVIVGIKLQMLTESYGVIVP